MPGFYQSFNVARVTEPDPASLLAQLRALDPTAGVQHDLGSVTFRLKKSTDWTAPQIAAAQNALETATAISAETIAQAFIDNLSIPEKAILLTLLDQINVIRAALPVPLGVITPAQAIAAVRAKAGTL